jgi:Uma2 family endonuclease
MTVQDKIYTIKEFEEFTARPENGDRLFELINGEIVAKVVTEEHGVIAANIVMIFGSFVKANKLGRVMIEVDHKTRGDDYNERLPDIAFTSKERTLPLVKKGAVPQMPDLAIEIKSPTDTYKAIRAKADYYLANGAKMVWLIFPAKRIVEIYRVEGDDEILTKNDVLSGEDVVPGFTMAVKDIFAE